MKSLLLITVFLTISYNCNAFRFGTYYDDPTHQQAPVYSTYTPYQQTSYEAPVLNSRNSYFQKNKYHSYNNPEANAQIVRSIDEKHDDGSYRYGYETDNQIRVEQTGFQNGDENVVRGSYSYVGPDGVTYTTHYIADRNGYRAYGAHLPTQPEEVIQQQAKIPQQVTFVTPRPYAVAPISSTYSPYVSSTISPYVHPQHHNVVIQSTPAPYYDGVISRTLSAPHYSTGFSSLGK